MITADLVRRRMRGAFFGWWIVAGGAVIQTLTAALLLQSYGVYVTLLQAEFGWSKTAFSSAFALQRAESGLLGPLQGWMLDRFGPRFVMRIGIAMFGVGFMLFSQINTLPMFFAVFLMMAVGTSLGGFLSIATSIVNWFARKRSMAMGLMGVGMSVGGFLVPVVTLSLTTYGWRTTAFASGLLVLVIGLPCTQLMRHRPEDYGLRPDGELPRPKDDVAFGGQGGKGIDEVEFTGREALRTPAFWLLSLGHSTALLVVSAVWVHLVPHLTEGLGYTALEASFVVSLLTGVTMVGQLIGGYFGDRFSKRLITTLAMFGHAVAFVILAWAPSIAYVVVFAILQGLAHGFRGVLMQPIRADYFGRRSFGSVMGYSSMIVMIGSMAGPIMAGIMADRLGNYQLSFTLLGAMCGVGSIFFALAKKPTPPRRRRRIAADALGD